MVRTTDKDAKAKPKITDTKKKPAKSKTLEKALKQSNATKKSDPDKKTMLQTILEILEENHDKKGITLQSLKRQILSKFNT